MRSNFKLLSQLFTFAILFLCNCVTTQEEEILPSVDAFWSGCRFFNDTEMAELDELRQQLIRSNSLAQDKTIFDKYLKKLNLNGKTDEQILSCIPASPGDKERLMKHFVYLGLQYGKGEFSFIDNPRLASIFEMNYFYNIRDFLPKSYSFTFSQADKKVARYLLGGLIVMQAAQKMKSGDTDLKKLAQKITDGFSILKYGRTSVFTEFIYKNKEKLREEILALLMNENSFSNSYEELKGQVNPKIYPMLLKSEKPYWPIDYSEYLGARFEDSQNVFGVNSAPNGTQLTTGFFAKSNQKIVFITAGHWNWNKQFYIMKQVETDPIGSASSQKIWLKEKLAVLNFSEDLLVPALKALDLDTSQINTIQAKIGSNPFSTNFSGSVLNTQLLTWIDMAIAIPTSNLIRDSVIDINKVNMLGSIEEKVGQYYCGNIIGMGLTEDLLTGNPTKDKSPGLKRYNLGHLSFIEDSKQRKWMVIQTPFKLEHLSAHPYGERALSVYSMRFGPRCSGAPFIVGEKIVGLLQGAFDTEDSALHAVHFTPKSLALIDRLANDPRGLHGIPENDLVQAVRTHMFPTQAERERIRDELIRAYLQ